MFDPTAFDNMKVVLEGAFYDEDLEGSLHITDRNDFINMAKMERLYELHFRHSDASHIAGRIRLAATLEQLSAELLTGADSKKAGCFVTLLFRFDGNSDHLYEQVSELMNQIWGEERSVSINLKYDPYKSDEYTYLVGIDFKRLIIEDQMDDLIEMIPYIKESLILLQSLAS